MNSQMENSLPGKGMAITGMVLGIIALICVTLLICCTGTWGSLFGLPLSVAGLIVSIVAIKKGQNHGICVAGIVCSVIALGISALFMLANLTVVIALLTGNEEMLNF